MLRRMAGFLALLLAAGVAGCGSGNVGVVGAVTLDGQPVEGATVSCSPQEETGRPASGITDASGKVTLTTDGKPGMLKGNYKVVVTKTEAVAGGKELKPGDPDYMKSMQKGIPKPGMIGPGPGAGPKSLLPDVYSKATSTPLTLKVPPESSPVKLELKSK